MNEGLRRAMMAADGAGELSGEGVRRGRAEHPVCGDVVQVDVLLGCDRIEAVAWRAHGCPACVAVAAVSQVLRGCAPPSAAAALRQRLSQLGGLQPHEQHAERLFLDALSSALAAPPGSLTGSS